MATVADAAAIASEIQRVQRLRRGEEYRRRLGNLGLIPEARPHVVIDATGLPRALATWLRYALRTKGRGPGQVA